MSESTGSYRNLFKVVNSPEESLYIFRYASGWPFLLSKDTVSPHKHEKKFTQVEYFKRILQPHYTTEKLISIPKLLPTEKAEKLITNLTYELYTLGYPMFHHINGFRLQYTLPTKTDTPIVEQLCKHLLELPIKPEDKTLINAATKEAERLYEKAHKNREAVKRSTSAKPIELLQQLDIIKQEAENTEKLIDNLLLPKDGNSPS